MKRNLILVIIAVVVFAAGQFIRPSITNPPVTQDISAAVPANVKAVLEKGCYDCHSNETNLKWFDKITPANFLVATHVRDGRKALNFSHWDSLPPPAQKNILFWAVNDIRNGEMPLNGYLALHGAAKLDDHDIAVLEDYLTQISPRKISDTVTLQAIGRQHAAVEKKSSSPHKIADEWNGLAYIKGWQNWKAISTTDRFDNGTMRVIYGNDIAINAIAGNHINPWPDGTVFAKAAWKENMDSTGNVSTGEFWQVEFMVKDAVKYKDTKGWGWGRWRGLDLQPYGKDALFVTECTRCHAPVKDNDFVFTYPIHLSN